MGLGMLFLKYGRDDELQADRLGARVRRARRVGSGRCGRHAAHAVAARRVERERSPRRAELAGDASRAAGARRAGAAPRWRRRGRCSRTRPAPSAATTTCGTWRASSTATTRVTASCAATRSSTRTCGSRSSSPRAGTITNGAQQVVANEPGTKALHAAGPGADARGPHRWAISAGSAMRDAGFKALGGGTTEQFNGLDAWVGYLRGEAAGRRAGRGARGARRPRAQRVPSHRVRAARGVRPHCAGRRSQPARRSGP